MHGENSISYICLCVSCIWWRMVMCKDQFTKLWGSSSQCRGFDKEFMMVGRWQRGGWEWSKRHNNNIGYGESIC